MGDGRIFVVLLFEENFQCCFGGIEPSSLDLRHGRQGNFVQTALFAVGRRRCDWKRRLEINIHGRNHGAASLPNQRLNSMATSLAQNVFRFGIFQKRIFESGSRFARLLDHEKLQIAFVSFD